MTTEIFYHYTDGTISTKKIKHNKQLYCTEYFKDNRLHRSDGPAREYSDGTKEYSVEGKWHRLDGPAIEYANGHKEYFVEGKRQRLDGPAIEYASGDKEYLVNGVDVTDKLKDVKEEDIPKYLRMLSL